MPASPLFCAPTAPPGLDCGRHRWHWPEQPVWRGKAPHMCIRTLGSWAAAAKQLGIQPTNEDAGGGVRNNIWPPAAGGTRGAAAACISTVLPALKRRRLDGHACMQVHGAARQAPLMHHCKPGVPHDEATMTRTAHSAVLVMWRRILSRSRNSRRSGSEPEGDRLGTCRGGKRKLGRA